MKFQLLIRTGNKDFLLLNSHFVFIMLMLTIVDILTFMSIINFVSTKKVLEARVLLFSVFLVINSIYRPGIHLLTPIVLLKACDGILPSYHDHHLYWIDGMNAQQQMRTLRWVYIYCSIYIYKV